MLNLPSLGFANQAKRKQRIVFVFSPNGIVPKDFWPDEEGANFKLKEILEPLEPFKKQLLTLHGMCDSIRGDGDGHMRGIGCLLTGIELFPGNIQGGSDTPAGWAKGISRRPGDQELTSRRTPRPRRASARWNSASWCPNGPTPGRAGATPGANKPITPIDDPYQLFNKLYGRAKDREALASVLDEVKDDLKKVGGTVGAADKKLLEEHATFVREMEKELKEQKAANVGHAVPKLEPGVQARQRQHAEDLEDADRPAGEQLRRRLHSRGDVSDHQLGRRRADEVAGRQRGPPRPVARAGHEREGAGEAGEDQQVVLRAGRVPREAARRDAGAGRQRHAARQHD